MNSHELTVLLIEDSPEDADLVQAMLLQSAASDIELVRAARLADGLERLARGGVSLVLLDLSLPDSQGLGTFRKIQSEAPEVPVVALTGFSDEKAALRAVGEGLQDYLVKGQIDSRLLVRTIRHAVERHQLQRDNRDLVRMKERLEASNAELERFAYTVSHDLKSPLFTIEGYLGLLERDSELGDAERSRKDIEHIRGAVLRMTQLLDELLELARVGWVVNAVDAVALSELAREATGLVAGRIAEQGVEVVVPRGLPVVRGDRQRLLEVFQNLIDNAASFSYPGPSGARIEIAAELRGDEVLCCVRDNGPGIEPRYHEKVFGLFQKLDPRSPGNGIGLAIVKRIVEGHGGRIWIESEGPATGAAFFFTLPVPDGETPDP